MFFAILFKTLVLPHYIIDNDLNSAVESIIRFSYEGNAKGELKLKEEEKNIAEDSLFIMKNNRLKPNITLGKLKKHIIESIDNPQEYYKSLVGKKPGKIMRFVNSNFF